MKHKTKAKIPECVAFHEAGHAIAISLNNKTNCLPPVFFQIRFKTVKGNNTPYTNYSTTAYYSVRNGCMARMEGGRLIQSLPPSLNGLVREITQHHDAAIQLIKDYMIAFETDIINMLAGPLAEAKYIAETDNEPFSPYLVNIEALKNYGGHSDLALATEYIQSFSDIKQEQDEKLYALFMKAFKFVTDKENWQAIIKLAHHIQENKKNHINSEEVALVLEE